MNSFVDKMKQHVSVRDFEDTPLSGEIKDNLLTAAQSGSSSNFVQAFSIIEITDSEIRKELAELSNSAAYVIKSGTFYVFIADLYRQATMLAAHNLSLKGIQNMEALLVSIVDTTIAAENMAVAAESMDLGICYIGGIRNNLKRVAELLDLPPYTVPLFGMTVGVPRSKNEVKPRMPKANQVSQNVYNKAVFTDLSQYDKETKTYYAERGNHQLDTTWTARNIDFFKQARRTDVGDFLKKQGFSLK
ncbi:NADPH-dependent oxidoreductase [Paenibacillus turicensis]|uniref:NADPH-dependent oxidoreductase n=1 Tax=Paenibacillus turicensis TaxID=160487 RepID=UPI003D29E023